MIQRERSRLVTAVAVGITALLVVATGPTTQVSASERSSRVAKGAAWDAQALPALPGSSGSGQLFRPLVGVVVPLRSTGESTSTEPTLEVDKLDVSKVVFRVTALSNGQVKNSPAVDVRDGQARWKVTQGFLVLGETYRVSVVESGNTQNVVLSERNLHVDPQRSAEQKLWSFAGISAGKVTGEPVWGWSSPTLETMGGAAGFSLLHRPTNGAQGGLPKGWQLSPSSVGSRWKTLTLTRNGSSARLTAWDGWTVAFERSSSGAFLAQLGENDTWPAGMYATLNANPAGGGWTVTNTNQSTTSFPAADVTQKVTLSPSAVWTDGSPVLQQTWVGGRLDHVTDPVSGRQIQFFYGPSEQCIAPVEGFIPVPDGMLCAALSWDGAKLALSYVATEAGVQIGRITGRAGTGTSAQVTDLAWDKSARITGIRAPLAAAATAAEVIGGLGRDDARSRTTITYDGSGRVQTITAPAGLVSGEEQTTAQSAQPVQSLEYSTNGALALFTVRQNGVWVPFLHRAEATFNRMNQTKATASDGQSTVMTYNPEDQAAEVLDVASGTRTRTVYDAQGRPVKAIGPSRRPLGEPGVPVVETRYDTEDSKAGPGIQMRPITGLVMMTWDNNGFAGAPADRSIGPRIAGKVAQKMQFGWTSNPSGNGGVWSGRLAGKFVAETAGTYSFRSDDRARLIVNGRACTVKNPCEVQLGREGAADLQAEVVSTAGGAASVDLQVATGAGANLKWNPIGGTETSPGLNQVTEQIVSDQIAPTPSGSKRMRQISAYDWTTGSGNLVSQTSESGATVSHTWDTYTGRDGHYGQHLSWTGPGGKTTTYGYHDASAPAAGCDGSAVQGGLLASTTRPGGVTTEQSYNAAGGTTKATGNGTETCINYRADGSASGGSVTGGGAPYSAFTTPLLSGNPLEAASTVVSQGVSNTSTQSVSITGQVVRTTDARGTTTTFTYDPWTGNLTSSIQATAAGETRTSTFGFDKYGRPDSVEVNGVTLSTSTYRSNSTVLRVNYENGTTSELGLDANNNINSVQYDGFEGDVSVGETDVYSRGGAILTRNLRGTDGTLRFDATYDLDHRLVSSVATGSIERTTDSTTVEFEGAVGANGNRTSQTAVGADGQAITSSFTYDESDRLVGTTLPTAGTPSYDVQGRTTAIEASSTGSSTGNSSGETADARPSSTATGASTLEYDAGGILTEATGPRGSIAFAGDDSALFTPAGGGEAVTLRPSGDLLLDAEGAVVGQLVDLPQGVTVALDSTGTPVQWQYADLQGSKAWTSSGNKAPSDTTVYDPWGTQISKNERAVPTTPLQLALSMSGWKGTARLPIGDDFYRMGNREYSPATGRFLQRDPLIGGSTNSYEVAIGDPLNNSDPSGNFSLGQWIGLAVSIVLSAAVTIATAGAYAAIAATTIGATWQAWAAAAAIGAVAGAFTGFATSVVEQAIDNNGDVDFAKAGLSAGISGAIGVLGIKASFGNFAKQAAARAEQWAVVRLGNRDALGIASALTAQQRQNYKILINKEFPIQGPTTSRMAFLTSVKVVAVFIVKRAVYETFPEQIDQIEDAVGLEPDDPDTGPLSGTADAGSSGAALITSALGG
ncbi:MAG: RHS repeat-associated core domain-containing protein [Actinomycetes bacterium]